MVYAPSCTPGSTLPQNAQQDVWMSTSVPEAGGKAELRLVSASDHTTSAFHVHYTHLVLGRGPSGMNWSDQTQTGRLLQSTWPKEVSSLSTVW